MTFLVLNMSVYRCLGHSRESKSEVLCRISLHDNFYDKGLLASPPPTHKLEDRPLLAFSYCLFRVFTRYPPVWRASPVSVVWGRAVSLWQETDPLQMVNEREPLRMGTGSEGHNMSYNGLDNVAYLLHARTVEPKKKFISNTPTQQWNNGVMQHASRQRLGKHTRAVAMMWHPNIA
jgi:hypothetical protein